MNESYTADRNIEDAYPLCALKGGMVFHTQLEKFSRIYHDIDSQYVRCPWDRQCFERALSSCIQEHPILRTGFFLDGDRPLQVVYESCTLPLFVEDLQALSGEEQELYIREWMEQRKRHEFDWERGPLFAIHIMRRGPDSFQFIISYHHAVVDGWSGASLTTTLYNRYRRLLEGAELEPFVVNWAYRDFISLEQQVLSDEQAKVYFGQMLESAPTKQLPRLKGEASGHLQRQHVVNPFTELSQKLVLLAQQLGVPVQAVLLSVHFKVLSVLSGHRWALSCVTHNGRPEQEGAEQALGLFLNSLPLALEVGDTTWRELVAQVAALGTASLPYRRYPLVRIQQQTGLTLSEVTFNYTHLHAYNEIQAKSGFESLGRSGYGQTNFDLMVVVSRSLDQEQLNLKLMYNGNLFENALIERIGDCYLRGFQGMLGGLDQPHEASSLFGTEDRERFERWNDTDVAYSTDRCIHKLFEEQVRAVPDAVAVIQNGRAMTYRKLNELADRLSRCLMEQGVGDGSRVGVYLGRSFEQVIGVLGILKAGAPYVALERGLPRERIQFLLEDSDVSRVLLRSESIEDLPLSGIDLVLMDKAGSDEKWLLEYAEDKVIEGRRNQAPRSLMYVLYTSGSTGKPKGLMVDHSSM